MCVCVHALPAEVSRCHSVQTGVHFRRVEVGQLVAREPSLGVAHVTQISVSPVFLPFLLCPIARSRISICNYWILLWGLTDDIFIENFLLLLILLQAPKFPAVICRCWCSVAVRMQQLALKVLCFTLLLLAVVPSVYSQSGMGHHLSISMYFWSSQKRFWCVFLHLASNVSFPWLCVSSLIWST